MPWAWTRLKMAQYIANAKILERLRTNDESCIQWIQKPGSKYLIFSDGKPFLKRTIEKNALENSSGRGKLGINWIPYKETQILADLDLTKNSILLGIDENDSENGLFAYSISGPNQVKGLLDKFGNQSDDVSSSFVEMRKGFLGLDCVREAGLVAKAYTLINWLGSTKFCSTCGSKLVRNVAGTHLRCTTSSSDACNPKGLSSPNRTYYPITHPVAITLVQHESDPTKVLLVRQSRHPTGMYSCIAGFMEPGESLEEAVRREIAEEAGIVVGKVEYFDSQTWPLPQNTLMLGCMTKAMVGSEKLDIDKEELQDARWVEKSEIIQAYERIQKNPGLLAKNEKNLFIIPPKGAIAHDLLKNWAGL